MCDKPDGSPCFLSFDAASDLITIAGEPYVHERGEEKR